ncbi:hypothetical protein ACWDTT_33410 [Streptosporangium sandarakinum]|uniref:hypothetical protein n=1 Tax=Streptosporangium TaxID=2000 RepID=UPI0031F75CDB
MLHNRFDLDDAQYADRRWNRRVVHCRQTASHATLIRTVLMRDLAKGAAPGLGATMGTTQADDHEPSRMDLNSRRPDEQQDGRL